MDGFRSCQVDGDLLLRLTENELSDSIEMGCAITRERWVQLCQFVFCSMMKNELLDSIEMGNHTQTVGATVSAV